MTGDDLIRVVIVDDHGVVRSGIASIIDAQPDMRVVGEADCGSRGAETAHAMAADVVLMDISMPGSDGLAGLRAIKELSPQTRVVMLTTFNVPEQIEQSLRLGASGYLLKTSSTEEVVTSIRSAHQGSRVFSGPIQDLFVQSFLDHTEAAAEPPEALQLLTARELDVFGQLARGQSNAEIAATLFLSEATVKTYVTRLLAKLGLRDRVQAVIFALQHGLIAPDDGRES